MADNTRSVGFWEWLRRLPERTPLRTKLIAAVLALVAVALLVMSVAGLSFLRSYLLGAADNDLSNLAHSAERAIQNGTLPPRGLAPEGWGVVLVSKGKAVQSFSTEAPLAPQVPTDAPWLTSGNTTTVSGTGGHTTWSVVALPAPQGLVTSTGSPVTVVVVGIDVSDQYSTIGKLTTVDVVVSVLILLAVVAIGAAVIHSSLRPLTEIEETA